MESINDMNELHTEAGIQDNLLQSYRSFQLTTQSIFIAIGTGLTLANIATVDPTNSILLFIVFISISTLAIYSLLKIRKVIISRGKDVDYWHNKIIETESQLDADKRHLTRFKVYQKFHRNKLDYTEFKQIELDDEARKRLTEKGKGHTRNVVDTHLFMGYLLIWIIFFLVAIAKMTINFQ